MSYKITIRWGQDPEYWAVKRYEFQTKAELDAFRFGVDQAYQELDAQELPEYPETTYDIQVVRDAFAVGFQISVCHPDDPDDVITSIDALNDAEGHLFAIGEAA